MTSYGICDKLKKKLSAIGGSSSTYMLTAFVCSKIDIIRRYVQSMSSISLSTSSSPSPVAAAIVALSMPKSLRRLIVAAFSATMISTAFATTAMIACQPAARS